MRYQSTIVSFLLALAPLTALAAATCSTGECISTGSCSKAGGKSTPGLCPGAKDIQCCTYGTCKTKAGVTGTCQPTSGCSGDKTAGLCPGASNIQCCTPKKNDGGGGGGGGGGSCPPKVNQATVNLVKSFEGFVKSPAPDPIGLPTVGFGHLCKTKGCKEVPFKFPLTEAQAAELMQSDMKGFESCLKSNVKVKLNDNQYGALCSWAFNVGCGNVKSSTLLKRLNKGESPNTVAASELPKWNKAGGKTLPGLTRRRKAEVELFKKPSSVKAIPC